MTTQLHNIDAALTAPITTDAREDVMAWFEYANVIDTYPDRDARGNLYDVTEFDVSDVEQECDYCNDPATYAEHASDGESVATCDACYLNVVADMRGLLASF